MVFMKMGNMQGAWEYAFWADAIFVEDYKLFGDPIMFDITNNDTNKFIFRMFCRVNIT